jgi:DNA mismatch repair protein MutL
LTSDGRVLLDAPRVSSTAERIAALFGRKLAEQLIPVEHSSGYVTVRGFVQRPADAKASGRKAYLFVNGRPFRDPFIVRAAEAGYRATIAPGLRPTVLLDIAVPGNRVDVNVHPSKLEVRFLDKRFVEHVVEEAVRLSLRPMEAAAVVGGSAERRYDDEAVRRYGGKAVGGHGSADTASSGSRAPPASHPLFDQPETRWGVGSTILQLFNTYLLFETPEGVAIVDQHSAHERVLYEGAMAQLAEGGAAAQRLLLPLTLELQPEELEAVEAHRDLLAAVGFEVEPFGGRSVVVHAVPNPHPRFDAKRCLEELVADLSRNRFGAMANRLERFAATFACRAAIKAGHALEPSEMRGLLGQLFACDLPPHDVHGRPTIVQLTKSELDRRFGRT